MSVRRSRIVAVLLCAVMLTLAGCSQNDAEDAQAKVKQANAELQDAQAQLDKAKHDKLDAQKKADTAAADKQHAHEHQANAKRESDSAARQASAKSENQPVCNDCGTVRSITPVTANGKGGSGVGAVAGGVAGAVVGSQIGHGAGKTIAQIAGTLGGAYAGNEVEKRVRKQTYYQVNVAMDAGGSRSVNVDTANSVGVGTRVRVQGNNLVLIQ